MKSKIVVGVLILACVLMATYILMSQNPSSYEVIKEPTPYFRYVEEAIKLFSNGDVAGAQKLIAEFQNLGAPFDEYEIAEACTQEDNYNSFLGSLKCSQREDVAKKILERCRSRESGSRRAFKG